MIIVTRGVGPSLIVSHGHIDPMEPGSELLDSGFTEDADILRPQLSFMEIHLQWRQLCLHNRWQHRGAHSWRGASRSEVKLSDGETQHIGEVHQLLLRLAGEVCFEVVIDPLGQGSGLVQGRLENSVYIGHSLSLTPQRERER